MNSFRFLLNKDPSFHNDLKPWYTFCEHPFYKDFMLGGYKMLASKINKVRTLALLLVFLGIGVMYIGFLWRSAMPIFLILGMLVMFSSFGLYFWIGMLSTRATQVVCPNCERITKMLGKVDHCMFCKETLSLDPKDAPEPINPQA